MSDDQERVNPTSITDGSGTAGEAAAASPAVRPTRSSRKL